MQVLTRSYDGFRTGANPQESILTPQNVGSNLLVKRFSMVFNDDPRLEAQPLYVPNLKMNDGRVHNVVFVCTMANNVWAFDANTGVPIWQNPTNLGNPVKPKGTEIDMFSINILWGILSTPVIDLAANKMYVVNWTSPDATVAKAHYKLQSVRITDGQILDSLEISATADAQAVAGKPVATFVPSGQKQRASLLLTTVKGSGGAASKKVLFVGFGMTHEEHNLTHGWLLAYDVGQFRMSAAWCTTPAGTGSGVWHAGQGPAADENGDVYVMTGNYGVELNDGTNNNAVPAPGDLPESLVKLHYSPSAGGAGGPGKLAPVAWFTPFQDAQRRKNQDDDFRDYDLGSGGPIILPGLNLVVGAGKDGVLYVLDTNTIKFGMGSDFARLKQTPIFFTYFPGFGIDAGNVANLDRFYDGKTHHLHGSPAFWESPARGPMLFVWGENECLRAWTISAGGLVTFVAKSAEVASAGLGGKGGMPGGFPTISSNGNQPNTGIVWATAPISNDANKHVVEGILRAYDATTLDPVSNADGTPRLKLLWDSKHIPENTFHHCKFCPPVVADGQVFVPTYDGRIDVYGLVTQTHDGPLPTNANGVPEQ